MKTKLSNFHGCMNDAASSTILFRNGLTLQFGLWLLLGISAISSGYAQSYPSKPICFVIGLAPGGSKDVSARLLAQRLTEVLGHPVITENLLGAGAAIASPFIAKAPPDGYSLLLLSASTTILPAIRKDLSYDMVRDFAPITRVAITMYALLVHPSGPVKSVKDLLAIAKKQSVKMSYQRR